MNELFSIAGASLFKEIYCGHCDGQLCLHRDEEGRRGEAEGAEEGQEAASEDELQVGVTKSREANVPRIPAFHKVTMMY